NHSTKISAILGQDAFLPCETRRSISIQLGSTLKESNFSHKTNPNQSTDQINLILWYRNGANVPFYSIDARHIDESQYDFSSKGKHTTNDSRIEFDLRNLTPLLRIRNVTEDDDAQYECRVEYSNQRTFITQIRLTVIGAPISLLITDSNGNPLEGIIGPFNEFESITLVCTAYGGTPKPSVIWFRQRGYYEEIIDDSFEYVPLITIVNGTLSSVVNTLRLHRLDRNDYLAQYQCRAASRLYYPPLVQMITIDMNLHPVSVRIFSNQYHNSPQSSPLIAGQMAEFGCRSDGSKPSASIEWFLDHQRIVATNDDNQHLNHINSQPLSSTTISDQSLISTNIMNGKFVSIIISSKSNSTLSAIRFMPHYTDNGRILSCHSWNPFIANSKIADKLALDVKYAPHLTIGLGTKYDIISQQQHQSPPIDDDDDDDDDDDNLQSNHRSLLVREFAPILELNCHIKANPWIDQVQWYVNGVSITNAIATESSHPIQSNEQFYSSSIVVYDNGDSQTGVKRRKSQSHHNGPTLYLTNHNQTLRFENVPRYFTGQYQCAARNVINESRSETIQLNVAYKPQCVHNRTQFVDVRRNVALQLICRVDAYPTDSLTFNWTLELPWNSNDSPNEKIKVSIDIDDIEPRSTQDGDETISVLNVDRAVQRFVLNDPQRLQLLFHSPLLLQCESENVAGHQMEPCPFLLRLIDGPPQKITECNFTMISNQNSTNGNENSSSNMVMVQCLPGNDGGQQQTFHLIGFNGNQSSFDIESVDDKHHQSSIIELIQSTELSNSIQWNLSSPDVAQFDLTNVDPKQTYHLIIYSTNSIGNSEPLIYNDLVLIENRFNFGTTQAIRTNWAYARLRGLFVILGLLSLIALLGFAIRNYIYHNPIYESTIVQSHHHSDIDNHSADETNENTTMVINVSSTIDSNVEQLNEQTTETNENIEFNIGKDDNHGSSYCTIVDENKQQQKQEINTLKLFSFNKMKRLLNRIIFNGSHYRSYKLPETIESTIEDCHIDETQSLDSNLNQECIDWDAYQASRSNQLKRKTSKLTKLFHQFNDSVDSNKSSMIIEHHDNGEVVAVPERSRNVQLLLVFNRFNR
ncbi:hypothetical protein BLOT_013912, partial [Blomia tropicalis]